MKISAFIGFLVVFLVYFALMVSLASIPSMNTAVGLILLITLLVFFLACFQLLGGVEDA